MNALPAHDRPALGLVDAAADPHLSGAFEPVVDEVELPGLTVIGELPVELNGMYVRNGPNPRFTPLGSYLYPIDGDGMVHRMQIADGTAAYSNRFVRTPAMDLEEQRGRALWPGIMSGGGLPDPADVGPDLAYVTRDIPDVNIVRHAGRILALAESANPFCLSPDVRTVGRELFDGAIPLGITAHPKIDPVTGEMFVFCYMEEPPYLTWSVLGPDGGVVRAPTPVSGVDTSFMIHDMALTSTAVVLFLAPLLIDVAAMMSGGSPLSWRPELGTRIAIIPRDGGAVRWVSDEAFWLWHTANAFDLDDGRLVVDYVQYDHPGMGLSTLPKTTSLIRATIDPGAGNVTRATVDEASIEFPRIDDRRMGQEHDWIAVAAETGRRELPHGTGDAIRWYRPSDGTMLQWTADDLLLGEPTFAARPGDPDPDHGWWMTFATEPNGSESWFLLVPAADPASGPVARVRIPVRVPLGLHGNWLPDEE
ncbi:carotenoid cleavage dioxygenase [Antricoccus suffuscus]|uniref:Dioxygenase n=1 Tax=Antricoccus suffuscus TaxID=1629062 RepID=A0A2T0ZYZ4_9ACTN|nr:carotenoid oxygenase family protein [Antricoccus suffuscus]PRZ41457.1 carotenoid cleavage dioxygenase [Antricoccus suffuscus]